MNATSIDPVKAMQGGQKVLAAANRLKQQLNETYSAGELDGTIYSSLTISANTLIGKATEFIKLNEAKYLRSGGTFYLQKENQQKGMIINERT